MKASRSYWEQFDLGYFRRRPPFRAARRWLSGLAVVVPAGWLLLAAGVDDQTVFDSGPMSAAHELLAGDCGKCHAEPWRGVYGLIDPDRSARTMNAACLECHGQTIAFDMDTLAARHMAGETTTEPVRACADCHEDHNGPVSLTAVGDAQCVACHADLDGTGFASAFHASIGGFSTDHPEFRLLARGEPDQSRIRLNHAVHLKPGLRGPDGPVTMRCADCHRAGRSADPWPYGEPRLHDDSGGARLATEPLAPGTHMEPIRYSLHCADCHPLVADPVDRRLEGGAVVPHETPEAIRTVLRGQLLEYIRGHPAALSHRGADRVDRRPSLMDTPPEEVNRLFLEWVETELAALEQTMYVDKKTCLYCHEQEMGGGAGGSLPRILPPEIPSRWFAHASFDHGKHRVLDCLACHAGAAESTETNDVLLPGIETCRTCHAPKTAIRGSTRGGVAHACVTCHTYHRPATDPGTGKGLRELLSARTMGRAVGAYEHTMRRATP